MDRREFLKLSGAVVSTLAYSGCAMSGRSVGKNDTPPNIIKTISEFSLITAID